MTTAQKSKETRRMEMGSCISSQQSLHIHTLLHYDLKLPDVYVGIVGWIYRTKIDPISILLVSLFFEQWSSLHLFLISRNAFSLTCSWSFFLSFMVLAMIRVHSSKRSSPIAYQPNHLSSQGVVLLSHTWRLKMLK